VEVSSRNNGVPLRRNKSRAYVAEMGINSIKPLLPKMLV